MRVTKHISISKRYIRIGRHSAEIRSNFIRVGPWYLAKPRDPGQEFEPGEDAIRSYLYLIKHDFRDIKFKVRIRRSGERTEGS